MPTSLFAAQLREDLRLLERIHRAQARHAFQILDNLHHKEAFKCIYMLQQGLRRRELPARTGHLHLKVEWYCLDLRWWLLLHRAPDVADVRAQLVGRAPQPHRGQVLPELLCRCRRRLRFWLIVGSTVLMTRTTRCRRSTPSTRMLRTRRRPRRGRPPASAPAARRPGTRA